MTLQNTVKNGVARVQEGLQIFRKNVFDLQGVPAFLEFYNLYVWPWKYVYKGFYDAWHIVPVRAIDTSACQKDKDLPSLPKSRNNERGKNGLRAACTICVGRRL